MEKRKPSFSLDAFKAVCGNPATLRITTQARRDALSLGFDLVAVAAVIRTIDRSMFFKSMTSYGDHREWQDVYYVPAGDLTIYLKFTEDAVIRFVVLSFKER